MNRRGHCCMMYCREQQRLQPEVACVATQTDAEKLPSPEPTPPPPQQQSPVDSSGEDTETEDTSEDASDIPRVGLCLKMSGSWMWCSSAPTAHTRSALPLLCQAVVQHVKACGMRDACSRRVSHVHAAPWTVGQSQQRRICMAPVCSSSYGISVARWFVDPPDCNVHCSDPLT